MKININKQLILEVADDIANATGIDFDPETPEDEFSGKSALIGAGTALGLVGASNVYAKRNAIKAGVVNKYNDVKTKANNAVTGVRQNVANKIYPEGPTNAATAQAKYEKDLAQSKMVNEKLHNDNKVKYEKALAQSKNINEKLHNDNKAQYEKNLAHIKNINEKLQNDNKAQAIALKNAKAAANTAPNTVANTAPNTVANTAPNTVSKPAQKTVSTVMGNLKNKAQNRTTK
jgi:hypothetical protein